MVPDNLEMIFFYYCICIFFYFVSPCSSLQVKKSEMQIARLNRAMDDKQEEIQHVRDEKRSKIRFLKVVIQDLRRQFSGALPLGQQERFSETLRLLQEKRIQLESNLHEVLIVLHCNLFKTDIVN